MQAVLELGKAGSAGTERGQTPVLRSDAVVATLRASNWREAATACVGEQEWTFARRDGLNVGRWAADPEDAARLRARQTSWWKGTWTLDLEGTTVMVENVSWWKGTRRYLVGGRPVAESRTTGGWWPRAALGVDGDLPLHHQVFMLWLEVVLRRRAAAAAAA